MWYESTEEFGDSWKLIKSLTLINSYSFTLCEGINDFYLWGLFGDVGLLDDAFWFGYVLL